MLDVTWRSLLLRHLQSEASLKDLGQLKARATCVFRLADIKFWLLGLKVLHEELQDIKSVLEEYNQRNDLEVKASKGS